MERGNGTGHGWGSCSCPCEGSAHTWPSGAPGHRRWTSPRSAQAPAMGQKKDSARSDPPAAHAPKTRIAALKSSIVQAEGLEWYPAAHSCAGALTTWCPERICLATMEAKRPSMCARASMMTCCKGKAYKRSHETLLLVSPAAATAALTSTAPADRLAPTLGILTPVPSHGKREIQSLAGACRSSQ